ncbi:division/cell wall cluster transcriptional repressor MraZ [Opitutales bacterium ASA1]|uniref:division/cell wall cluster transcriptional repressor MraZ n=1 Tax=Congregicoccus parvus TaxID=3081749 RepID=UPI002B2ED070|nr:division/cell wall cluster transcriptional repressor MraZ [Opitutales bacterium ASA1]
MSGISKPFYVGNFRHALDAKNRLTIPAKWRFAGDENEVYLALPNASGYVMVLPPAEVEKLYQKISAMPYSDAEAQELQHKLFGLAHQFGCDKQGRINIPEILLRHAGITKEAVLVGTMNKFGLWSPERWASMDPVANGDNFGDLMKRFGI